MICCRDVLFDSEELADSLGKTGSESGVSIRNDLLGDAIMGEDMCGIKFDHF